MSASATATNAPKFTLKDVSVRFAAWWNGTEPVENTQENQEAEAPALEVVENSNKAPSKAEVNEAALKANCLLWGNGRTTPLTEYFDKVNFEGMEFAKGKKVVIFGAEAGARAKIIFDKADVKIDSYEQNSFLLRNSLENLKDHKKFKNFNAMTFDGTPGNVAKNKADVLLMYLRATDEASAEAHVFAAARSLKPKGRGYWFDFFANGDIDITKNYAQPEGRQFIKTDDLRTIMDAAGLAIESENDISAELLNAFTQNQNLLKKNWDEIQAQLIESGGIAAANSALSQFLGWRTRIEGLKAGRICMKKIAFEINQ